MSNCFIGLILLGFTQITHAQTQSPVENIIIITTDGFRWQDVFTGMDSAIAVNKKFNEGDSSFIFDQYWDPDVKKRRARLLPFLWSTFAANGQLYGNRLIGNNVDNANPYWFSYPGYSEIFCGFVDTAINSNDYTDNPHTNLLEFIHQQIRIPGSVAAFCAWDAFERILNEERSKIPVVSGFEECGGSRPSASEKLLNAMVKDSYRPWGNEECLDVFTHYEAREYLKTKHPRVLYISYGETDEWAHAGKYKTYLNAAHQVDAWLKQLWAILQSDPRYKNKSAIFMTVDHGRGGKEKWTSHGKSVEDSHEIWFGVSGPNIPAKGEVQGPMQFYQKQFAQTIASLLGLRFSAEHPVADRIESVFK